MKRSKSSTFKQKFGEEIAKRGFVQVPVALLSHVPELGLRPIDLAIILSLFHHWWYREAPPFPSIRTLATEAGASPETVARSLRSLVERGLIVKENRTRGKGGNSTCSYGLEPLITRLEYLIQPTVEACESGNGSGQKDGLPVSAISKNIYQNGGGHDHQNDGAELDLDLDLLKVDLEELDSSEVEGEQNPTDGNQKKFLEVLKSISGYPFDSSQDSDLFSNLTELYPGTDLTRVALEFKIKFADYVDSIKKGKSPRSILMNFAKAGSKQATTVRSQKSGKKIIEPTPDQSGDLGWNKGWSKNGEDK